MVLKIEIPANISLNEGDEIVIKFTGEKTQTSILHSDAHAVVKKSKEPHLDSCLDLSNLSDGSRTSKEIPESCTTSFTNYVNSLVDKFKQQKKYRLMETYTSTMRSFLKYSNNKEVALEIIDSKMICDYECFLRQSGLTLNTVSFYMRILRSIYNKAVYEKLIVDKKPFEQAFTKCTKTVKRAISVKMIRKIANAEIPNKTEELRLIPI